MTNEELKKELLDAYKRGYEEALNDCVRNGGEAWARSMFANNAEHIKPKQAEPVTWAVCDPSGEAIYAALFKTRCVEYMDNEYRYGHSAAKNWTVRPVFLYSTAEVQRLREALEYLIEKCGDSDDAQYSTLGTKFVRDIARRALEGE